MPIKDFIHHYPRALFNDIPRVGGALLRHTRVGAQIYDIPGSGRSLTTYPGQRVRTEDVPDIIRMRKKDGNEAVKPVIIELRK